MSIAMETAGLFLVIAALLRFSSWAEAWLASSPKPIKSNAQPIGESAPELEIVRAA